MDRKIHLMKITFCLYNASLALHLSYIRHFVKQFRKAS
ncbi:hypothetical protein D083_3456 [Dickeya solani RNS 08.23.3.1.A]|nr:hypothetical protein D083_3456 [Dickeya solani RNS 08.23.3.1.A]